MRFDDFDYWISESPEPFLLGILGLLSVLAIFFLARFAITLFQTAMERREIYSNVIPLTRTHHPIRSQKPRVTSSLRRPPFMLFALAAVAGAMNLILYPERESLSPSSGPVEQRLVGMVTHVRDGDTIEVVGKPIRLAKLDCAEKGTLRGSVATRRIYALTKGQSLTCRLSGRKSYDRWIGECSLRDGVDLGDVLIREGYCKRWR